MDDSKTVVQIDENRLDRECVRLPSDYLFHAHKAAEAKKDMDEAKSNLDVVQARLANAIRENPEKYGINKVTESAISSAILMQVPFAEASKSFAESRHAHDLAQAVVWALETKKRSLTLLVELHGLGYYSAPKISREGQQAVEEMTKRSVRRHRSED